MTSTYKRSTTDDFNGILALMPKRHTNSNNNEEAACMSRFTSNLNMDHDAIINGMQLNQHLTQIYSTRGETAQSSIEKILLWSADDSRPNVVGNLGTYDRLVWSGKFENLGGTDGTVFKHAEVNGISTDGFMFIPSPYHDFNLGDNASMRNRAFLSTSDSQVTGYLPAESFRVKLRFNNLQPKTFVPLFGYVVSMGKAPSEVQNAMGTMYRPREAAMVSNTSGSRAQTYAFDESWFSLYYNFPGGIAINDNNIMGYGVSADIDMGKTYTSLLSNAGTNTAFLSRENFETCLSEYLPPGHIRPDSYSSTSSYYHYNSYRLWRGEACRHSVVYFLYAYDNNGKGMIISCAGEADELEAAGNASEKVFSYKPTNGYFGSTNRNGYLDFVAPYEITSFLADGTKSLVDLYNKYDPSTYAGIGPTLNDWTLDTPYRTIYTNWNDLSDPYIGGAGNNASGWYLERFGWGASSFNNQVTNARLLMAKYMHNYVKDPRAVTSYANDRLPDGPATGDSWNIAGGYSSAGHTVDISQNFQIVAYGDVSSNANLSNWEEIVIHCNTIAKQLATSNHNGYGIADGADRFDYENWDITNNTVPKMGASTVGPWTTRSYRPAQKLYTGKILNFVFRDVPGQKFNMGLNDSATAAHQSILRDPNTGNSNSNTTSFAGMGPSCLILRPSFRAEGEIHSFAYGAYHNQYDTQKIGGSSKLQGYERSGNDTEYLFTKTGYSYNPVKDASTNAGLITDPNSSISNPLFLFDDDDTTRASLTKAGISNAIYISLNDAGSLFTDTGNENSYEISNFSIFIRGITLSALSYHDLKFEVVDNPSSNANSLFASTSNAAFGHSHIQEIPINNVVSFPSDQSAYAVTFTPASTGTVKYSDLQSAYLKIWAEEQT